MIIEESQMWWYWPQIPWEVLGVFRGSIETYPSEYEAIWDGFEEINPDGENVSRQQILDNMAATMLSYPEFPEGYLRWDSDLAQSIDFLTGSHLASKDDPEPTGVDQINAQLYGYTQWQAYRLALAMQASKLTQFGRRGPQ